jgi:hypothetical protein
MPEYQPEPPSNQDWDDWGGLTEQEQADMRQQYPDLAPTVTQEGIPLELPEPPEGSIVIWQIEVKYFRQYNWHTLLESTFFTREEAYEKVKALRYHKRKDAGTREYRIKQTHYMPVKVVILKQDG